MGSVSSILDMPSTSATALSEQKKQSKASFADFFTDASSSTSESSTSTQTDADNTGLEEFMAYAKETPAQRMFDSWLKGQNITRDEYKSMTPEQQQALQNKFETYLKSRLDEKLGVSSTAAQTTSTLAS
ncbi:MAG: hypothetical protein P4K83_00685 [Terracidiphilus sp.]|nr:hypothetical protein [Terracidiphilus sp.]